MAIHNFLLKDLVFRCHTFNLSSLSLSSIFSPFLHLAQFPARPLVREAVCLFGTETSELQYLLNPERNWFSSLLLHPPYLSRVGSPRIYSK